MGSRAVLLCVELLRHGGQTTKQLSAVVKRLGNQQRNSSLKKKNPEWLRQPWPHFDMSQTHCFFLSPLSLCSMMHIQRERTTWQQEPSLTLHVLYITPLHLHSCYSPDGMIALTINNSPTVINDIEIEMERHKNCTQNHVDIFLIHGIHYQEGWKTKIPLPNSAAYSSKWSS